MIQRCTNPNRPEYARYGGRGVNVAPEWREFERFYADMGDPPPGAHLDRINNDGPYCKENCRWASARVNNRNRRDNFRVTAWGKDLTVSDWADETGLEPETIKARIKRGWHPERALTEPPVIRRKQTRAA